MNKELKDWEIQYLQEDKTKLTKPEKRIWTLVILSCIGLAILGFILWGNFMANMYAGNIRG
jgi:hypothetical protein